MKRKIYIDNISEDNYFGIFPEGTRLVKIEDDNFEYLNNNKFKNTFNKYKNLFLSYDRNDLLKLYIKYGILIKHKIISKNYKELKINTFSIDYIDYADKHKCFFEYDIKTVKDEMDYIKNLNEDVSPYFLTDPRDYEVDILIVEFVDELNSDIKGIYKFYENEKEYIYKLKSCL